MLADERLLPRRDVVAGVGIALLTRFLRPSAPSWMDAVVGIAGALILTWLFYAYQRWRFADYDARARRRAEDANGRMQDG